tara:strand:- start:930 stop:1466 length:537 start_codon:yes stop_codon:yes gene_type:complete
MNTCTYTYEGDFDLGILDLGDPASFINGVMCMEVGVEIDCEGDCPEPVIAGCTAPDKWGDDVDVMVCVDMAALLPGKKWEACLKALGGIKTTSDVRTAFAGECKELADKLDKDSKDFDKDFNAIYEKEREKALKEALDASPYCNCNIAANDKLLRPDCLAIIANNQKEDIQKRYLSKI